MSKEKQASLGLSDPEKVAGPVECLGQIFESDQARREHYLALLAEKLKDPEFRKTPGNGSPLLIGVAHELQKVEHLEPEEWDVPLDMVVTDKATYPVKK